MASHQEYAHIDAVLYNKGKITGFAEVKGVHKNIEDGQDVIVAMSKDSQSTTASSQ